MKRLIMTIAATLLSGISLAVLAQDNGTTYTSSVVGNNANSGIPNVVALNGEAKENLPGVYHITIRFNRGTKEITGGDWVRTVIQQEADGSQSEVGTLHGDITGGTISVDEQGRVTAINAATLTIAGGNKNYSGISGGSGVFEGSLQAESGSPGPPQPGPVPPQDGTPASVASPQSAPTDAGPKPGFSGTMTLHF